MRFTKTQSRLLAVGVILAVFVVGGLLTRSSSGKVTVPTIEFTKDENGSIDAKVVFGEFKKSEVKNGKKLWEIHATTGRYSPEKGVADLEKPEVTIFKDDDTITLTADKARVVLDGTTLSSVDAQGNVVATSLQKGVTLQTSRAIYDKPTEWLSCPDKVNIRSPVHGTISGEDLEGTIDVQKFTLRRKVTTYIEMTTSTKKKGT